MIPESGASKPGTVRVHITPHPATKGGYSGQGVPRQCAEINGLFQRATAEWRKRSVEHWDLAPSCHKVKDGGFLGPACALPNCQQQFPFKPGNQIGIFIHLYFQDNFWVS